MTNGGLSESHEFDDAYIEHRQGITTRVRHAMVPGRPSTRAAALKHLERLASLATVLRPLADTAR
jgi:hypothetical protein